MADAVAAGACDLAMLDVMKIGGVTGWMQAASLADAASLPVSSHIFVETSAHLLAATPTAEAARCSSNSRRRSLIAFGKAQTIT